LKEEKSNTKLYLGLFALGVIFVAGVVVMFLRALKATV